METETINKNAVIPKSLMSRINFFIFLIAIAVSSVLMSCNNAQGQGGGNSKTERWEYTFLRGGYEINSVPKEEINNLGKEGWELVAVTAAGHYPEYVVMYFKRKLP